MRVGYVLKRYPRYSETFIRNEIAAHEAAGLEVEVFSLRPLQKDQFQQLLFPVRAPVTNVPRKVPESVWEKAEKELAATGTPSHWSGHKELRNVRQAMQLACEVRARGIDHLHAHFASLATSVTRLAARFAGVSYSLTAHAKDIFHRQVKSEDMIRKLGDAAATITVSDYNYDYLRQRYGSAAARVRRVYNGLDLEHFPYQEPRERPPLVLAVGRLVEKKGFQDLVEACAILHRHGCRFSCRIIGSGLLETELRTQIHGLGLENRVELSGARSQSAVIEQVTRAFVVAAPCTIASDGDQDGMPTILLEAMALGTPCVSTEVSGIPEIIQDEVTGLAVPQRNPAALASAIERLLKGRDLRVRLSRKARDLIEANHDIRRNMAEMRSIFSQACRFRTIHSVSS